MVDICIIGVSAFQSLLHLFVTDRIYSEPCIRIDKNAEHYRYLQRASNEGRLKAALHGLNILGQVPWNINDFILDIASRAWNTGLSLPCLPSEQHNDKVAESTSEETKSLKDDPATYTAFRRALSEERAERQSLFSVRCDANYKLEIARAVSHST